MVKVHNRFSGMHEISEKMYLASTKNNQLHKHFHVARGFLKLVQSSFFLPHNVDHEEPRGVVFHCEGDLICPELTLPSSEHKNRVSRALSWKKL